MLRIAKFSLIIVMISVQIACTKKRDESFVQGQGRDLLTISNFDGKEFEVETLGAIADFKENPSISKSDKVTQKSDSNVSKMAAVKVETKAELLAEAPFIAIPNTKSGYKIKYQINDSFLVVLKVADKSLVHPNELPGAITTEGSTIVAIPIVGYPISGFYNAENVEVNGETSSKLQEIALKDKSGATYFKIDKNNRTVYQFQEKLDLFSKEYFTGSDDKAEWYFGQTIISAGGRNADYTGWVLSQQDNEANGLSKVKFVFNQSELRAVSTNKDSRLNNKDEIHQTVLVNLPIEWKEFRPTPKGAKSFEMKEEENTTVGWEKRRYVKINFDKAKMMSVNGDFRFVDLELDENYFSFTVFDPSYNLRVKQSFMRATGRPAYKAKRMLKEDFEKFGFFDTQKHEVDNFEKYRQEDYGKNIFINRFNVAQQKIVFHFTEGSDESLIPASAKAAEEWTRAFAAAGVPLIIEANTTERVRLGDIRYNQINLIRSASETNLFGYGPSITDPSSGEIISATTNMHITSIVGHLSNYIRNYIRYKSGQTKFLSVLEPATPDSGLKVKGDKIFVEPNAYESQFLKKFPVANSHGQVQMKELDFMPQDPKLPFKTTKKNFRHEWDMGISGKYLNEDIEQRCPELNEAASAVRLNKNLEKENELVIACAEKILPHKMFGTLLHELGHNFGLRHNFYGSVDALNFLTKEQSETKEQVQSSSVMEYSAFSEDRLNKVGKYDIAAIRYGYGDAVETKDGAIVPLNVEKTIDQNMKEKGTVARAYMFCTDEDVAVGTDPMCARHDAGTTPDQVISYMVNEFNASIANSNYRFDRQLARDPMDLTRARLSRFWIPMKKIYDEWRYRLNDHLGIGNEYLESFDVNSLETKIQAKAALCKPEEPNSEHCLFASYRKAADKIFAFAMQMATLPPKYCIGERNGKVVATEFSSVRGIIKTVNKFVPANCMDPVVAEYIKNKFNFVPEYESGYELEDVRLEMKVKMSRTKTDWYGNPLPEAPDIIGLMPEKMIAIDVLAARASLSMSADEKPFQPNFLDEPLYREKVLSYLADRITKGMSAERLLSASTKFKGRTQFLEKYNYEKQYVNEMTSSVFYGLDVPGKPTATQKRKKKFLVTHSSQKDVLDKAKYKVLGLDGTTYIAIMTDEATEAKKLLQMMETLPARIEAASPVNATTFVGFNEITKNFLNADGGKPNASKFLEFMFAIMEDEIPPTPGVTRSADEKKADRQRIHWKKILAKETSAMRELLSHLNDGEQKNWTQVVSSVGGDIEKYKNPALKEFSKDFADPSYSKIGEILFAPGYVLDQKTLAARAEEYVKQKAQEQSSAPNDDFYEIDELTTQQDMILNVLGKMRN